MKPILVFLWFLVMRETPAVIWTKDMVIPFNPRKFNYCSTPCFNPRDRMHPCEHVACNCNRLKTVMRELITDNLETYRKEMLDVYNEKRNRIASGAEAECRNCPKASNMRLLNYDLELEYIAGCYLKKFNYRIPTSAYKYNLCRNRALHPFSTGHSVYTMDSKSEGPIKYLKDLKDVKLVKDFIRTVINRWYYAFKEISNISNSLRRYEGGSPGFFQIVWARVSHVGCAIGRMGNESSLFLIYLECMYAGMKGGPNVLNEPVYIAGEPCTRCPFGTKCGNRSGLEALCAPIPEESSTSQPSSTSPLKLTNFKLSPNINQFPLMYGQTTEQDQPNIADGLISMAPSSPKSSLMTIIIMIWIVCFD